MTLGDIGTTTLGYLRRDAFQQAMLTLEGPALVLSAEKPETVAQEPTIVQGLPGNSDLICGRGQLVARLVGSIGLLRVSG